MSNKLKKKPSTRLSPELMTAAEVSGITGVKLEILRKWVDRMQRNLSEAYQKEAQEKLLKAEDCISAANVVCSALAIYETWWYKKALDRYMDNYTAAVRKMNSVGLAKKREPEKICSAGIHRAGNLWSDSKAAEWRTLHNGSTENRMQHVRFWHPFGAAAAPV